MSACPIELTFLGTASQAPSLSRNTSCVAVRFTGTGATWLFDCGEATQAIFITHLHGDHLFGLPGLLCTLSATAGDESRIVTVVGPTGIADYIRSTLLVSFSFLAYKLRVIELVSSPGDVARGVRPCCSATTITVTSDFEAAPAFCLDFTVEQVPAADGVWRMPPVGKDAIVSAGGLVHSTPCVGYVIQEPSVAGNLQMAYIKPRLDANAEGLKAVGVRNPASLLGKLKKGEVIELPDGSVLDPADENVLSRDRPGRRICILGDTCDSSAMLPLCSGCSVLVHEATNACVCEDDGLYEDVEAKARDHGHSTPQMAGLFAKAAGVGHLVLTHFSARYKGDSAPDSVAIMDTIAQQARDVMGLSTTASGDLDSCHGVHCARDFTTMTLGLDGSLSVIHPA